MQKTKTNINYAITSFLGHKTTLNHELRTILDNLKVALTSEEGEAPLRKANVARLQVLIELVVASYNTAKYVTDTIGLDTCENKGEAEKAILNLDISKRSFGQELIDYFKKLDISKDGFRIKYVNIIDLLRLEIELLEKLETQEKERQLAEMKKVEKKAKKGAKKDA